MSASSLAMSVADNGHAYAMTAASSTLSPAAQLSETYGGLSQVYCSLICIVMCNKRLSF